DCPRQWHRLSVRGRGVDDQRGLVPLAARPRRRRRRRAVDLGACRRPQSRNDGRLGSDRRCLAGAWLAAILLRPRPRDAAPRTLDRAPLPQSGRTSSRVSGASDRGAAAGRTAGALWGPGGRLGWPPLASERITPALEHDPTFRDRAHGGGSSPLARRIVAIA